MLSPKLTHEITEVSLQEYILMKKPSCKVHGFPDPVELPIVVTLVDTLLRIVVLGERGLVVIMQLFIFLLLRLLLLSAGECTSKWKGL